MLLKDWTWKILSPSAGKKHNRFDYPEYCVIWVFSIEKIKIEIKPEYLRRDDIENYLDIKQKEILENKKSKSIILYIIIIIILLNNRESKTKRK